MATVATVATVPSGKHAQMVPATAEWSQHWPGAVLCCTVLYRADTVMSYPAIIMISGAGLPEYEGNILHAQYILHKIIYSAVN